MLDLTMYGLMGLAAMLVLAFYFAYRDDFPRARETSSFDLTHNAHLNDSQVIEPGTGNPRYRGHLVSNRKLLRRPCCKQHRLLKQAPAPLIATVYKAIVDK
jgi:hypothetical protein